MIVDVDVDDVVVVEVLVVGNVVYELCFGWVFFICVVGWMCVEIFGEFIC